MLVKVIENVSMQYLQQLKIKYQIRLMVVVENKTETLNKKATFYVRIINKNMYIYKCRNFHKSFFLGFNEQCSEYVITNSKLIASHSHMSLLKCQYNRLID